MGSLTPHRPPISPAGIVFPRPFRYSVHSVAGVAIEQLESLMEQAAQGRKNVVIIKKILCPVDFFPASDAAVSYAAALPAGLPAKIHLLHVITPIASGLYAPYTAEIVRSMEESSAREMKRLAAKVRQAGIAVETDVHAGDIYDEILKAINVVRPQLLVVGTHGRRGINRWFMGSTTEKLLRYCPIPVLTINASIEKKALSPKLRRILVTTDFSEGTKDALLYALDLARKYGSEVTLLHVVDGIAADVSGDYRGMLMKGVQAQLDDLVPSDVRKGCNVVTRVATGMASRIIPRMLRTEKVDLLVMNIHGKSMLDRAMIGSTAERVVRAAHCPVMLIPSTTRSLKRKARPSRKRTAT